MLNINSKKSLLPNLVFFRLLCITFVISILLCITYAVNKRLHPPFSYEGYLTKEPEIEKIYSAQKYDRYRITFSIKNIGKKPWRGGLTKGRGDKVCLCLGIKDQPLLEYVLPGNVMPRKVINVPVIISIPKIEETFSLSIGLTLKAQEQFNPKLVEVMQIVNYRGLYQEDMEGFLKTRFITEAQGKVLKLTVPLKKRRDRSL